MYATRYHLQKTVFNSLELSADSQHIYNAHIQLPCMWVEEQVCNPNHVGCRWNNTYSSAGASGNKVNSSNLDRLYHSRLHSESDTPFMESSSVSDSSTTSSLAENAGRLVVKSTLSYARRNCSSILYTYLAGLGMPRRIYDYPAIPG